MHFGCFVQARWISSEPTNSDVYRSCSANINSENWEPTGDRSLDDPCPEVVFPASHTSNLNDSEQEETHHSTHPVLIENLSENSLWNMIYSELLNFLFVS